MPATRAGARARQPDREQGDEGHEADQSPADRVATLDASQPGGRGRITNPEHAPSPADGVGEVVWLTLLLNRVVSGWIVVDVVDQGDDEGDPDHVEQ